MKLLLLAIFLFLLSCAKQPNQDLYKVLEEISCPNESDFGGIGVGENETAALVQARSNMAQEHFAEKLKSSVDIDGRNINGVTSTSTHTTINQNVKLINSSDAKLHYSKRQGGQIGVIACMSRADAAKGFLEQQRLVTDSLEMISGTTINTEHPKHKNEAWQRTQTYYNNIVAIQNLLNGWGVAKADYFDKASEIYSKTREDYKNYCRNVKLHWNPEQENIYSEIAFSKLSSGIKMEKSLCNGKGISLTYKGSEPECSVNFGLNTCSYTHSLSLNACDGTEYTQLKNDAMGVHQEPDFALKKLQNNLKSAEFWNQWIQEIKQWSPQCK